jgi:hypothetical protein
MIPANSPRRGGSAYYGSWMLETVMVSSDTVPFTATVQLLVLEHPSIGRDQTLAALGALFHEQALLIVLRDVVGFGCLRLRRATECESCDSSIAAALPTILMPSCRSCSGRMPASSGLPTNAGGRPDYSRAKGGQGGWNISAVPCVF